MGHLKVVVGGGYGSEAKGRCVQWLTDREIAYDRAVAVIRVGGPNAGHCVVNPTTGTMHKLRQVPAAATNPKAWLLIGPGSEVNIELLTSEVLQLEADGIPVRNRLYVDPQATVLTDKHIKAEQEGGMNARLGSTASGVGAARADRIWRMATIIGDYNPLPEDERWSAIKPVIGPFAVADTRQIAQSMLKAGATVIVEGTQGVGLGLRYGNYPQCTSNDARAIDFLSLAGLSPWHPDVEHFEPWVVMRTRPIRVAGNSGPLKGETTWDALGIEPEITTVTKRVRRVGEWDAELARSAVEQNGEKVRIWLSMIDYEDPGLAGLNGLLRDHDWSETIGSWSDRVLSDTGIRPSVYGTGPATALWRRRADKP